MPQEGIQKGMFSLQSFSPFSYHAASGKVKVVGAVYDLVDGHVDWMGEHPDQAKLLGGGHEGHTEHKH